MRLHQHFTRVAGTAAIVVALVVGLGLGIGAPIARAAADPTTTTLESPTSSFWGERVTFTATVKDVPQPGLTPTGHVQFLDGSTVLGGADLIGGKAAWRGTISQ